MSETATKHILHYGPNAIEYRLHYAQRKTLGIRVHPDCSVHVVAPLHTTTEQLQQKLIQKARWILKQQRHFSAFHPFTPERQYVSGETHLYLGRQYRLKVVSGTRNSVQLKNGRLCITRKDEHQSAQALLEQWYREKALVHLPRMMETVLPLFARYKIQSPPLVLRKMPNRWGSCTPSGKVLLNPELIKAPKGCIHYVMVHELCHLVHPNHNKAFYTLLENRLPDWRKWKMQLEQMMA